MKLAVVSAFCAAAVVATGPGAVIPTRSELLHMLSREGRVPRGVPDDFECAWRALALEFAQQLQPFRNASVFQTIHDALELGALCNQTFVAPTVTVEPATAPRAPAAATILYVDAANGNDASSGTQAAPLQHLAFAVVAARGKPQPATIVLRGNAVHRLADTITLLPVDSGLSIVNFPGEQPVVSGGTVLKPTWAPVPGPAPVGPAQSSDPACPPNGTWTVYPTTDAMFDDWPDPGVFNVSFKPSFGACQAACLAYSPTCFAWIWYDPKGAFGGQWDGMCFLRTDRAWKSSSQHDSFSGRCVAPPPPPNVYVADLAAAGTPLPAYVTTTDRFVLTLLFSPDGGRSTQRAFRARFPNADLELDLYPQGWAGGAVRVKPAADMNTTVSHTPLPGNYGPGMFSDYWFGQGGPCDRFEDGEWNPTFGPASISYWCQPNGRTAGETYFVRSPAGFNFSQADLPNAPYAGDPVGNGMSLHYWRNGHWFSMMVRPGSVAWDAATNTTSADWAYGAFQGAEGDETGEDWYVEHVREELDSPKEFFFEAATQRLFYFHNASAGTPPPPSWTWEAPLLPCLINISGTAATPVRGVYITGITFTSAAASYLMAHGIPSGGDWGLSRMGAILVEGAEGVVLSQNTFSRLDGNAIFLSGYVRNATVDSNSFEWLGESAVASWGRTDGVDATSGTQPFGTVMTSNLCREIGMYEKQVSCYFAAASGEATLEANVFFNMPRAAINFNDDMAGGSLVTRNLVWNTCRESQDHGPFNSWGRVPYLVNWPNGTVSPGVKPRNDEISLNFMVAGGGANGGALDHDDGSSFYHDHDNFFVYGGHKSDFDGHAKQSYNNVLAFSNVYGGKCVGIMNLPHAAPNAFFAEGFYNNTCILANAGEAYMDLGACTPDATLANRMLLGGNRVLVPGGADAPVTCGKTYSFAAWAALGLDAGSAIGELPTSAQIVTMARAVLRMQ